VKKGKNMKKQNKHQQKHQQKQQQKQKKQQQNHGRRRKGNGQHSASHTLIKNESVLEMESDAESLFQEAVMLLEDSQNPDDYIMAEELLKEAVTHGHVGAQIQLGRILRSEGRHDKNGE
jgi:hypothetical protein